MSFEFKLPDLGEGLHEGTLVEWLVAIGDRVAVDQPFARVETDKAVVELPAPRAAVVEALHFAAGDEIAVGQVMVTFSGDGAPPEPPSPTTTTTTEATSAPADPGAAAGGLKRRFLATPRTRALARKLGVDLADVVPSGRGGKITDEDVLRATTGERSGPTAAGDGANDPSPARRTPPTDVLPKVSLGEPVSSRDERGHVERRPVTHLRRVIAEAMSVSKRTAAHVTHIDDADVTELLAFYQRAKTRLAGKVKLTLLPYLVKAVVATLKNHPLLNASYDAEREEIVIKQYYDLGIAVDTDEGLMVPVLRAADQKDLLTIARELEDLATRARQRRLKLDELRGASFTISSLGPLGGAFATPIIHQPEMAIVGLHAIKERPAVVDGQVLPRKVMFVSLSYDHRFVDGAVAARFVTELVDLLQSPELLLLGTTSPLSDR